MGFGKRMEKEQLSRDSFFSVGFDLITLEENLTYDLYINSSTRENRERFVRIFPKNGRLQKVDVETFRSKYHQLYVLETQRADYLQSLVKNENFSDIQKTEIIKDSAIGYLHKIFDPSKEFTTNILGETIVGCRDSVEYMIDVLEDYAINEVQDLIGDLSFHDFYTYDHSINVSMYCISLFKAIKPGAKREELVLAGLGGLLHDLGKIKIPTTIINNPGKLSDDDFEMIKKHPGFGGELLDEKAHCCEGVDFEVIRRVITEHHENYNGSGYPLKIEGKDIHVLARVCAIADFFDAITTKRSYHEVLSTEDALAVMSKSVGRKIDPKIFEIFCENVNQLGLQGKIKQELPDDFDPCQPQNVLPLIAPNLKKQAEDIFKKEGQSDFGKVKGDSLFGKKKKAG